MRRPENQTTVVGTILGSVDGSRIDLQTCFPVPISLGKDGTIEFDTEYASKMLNFQRKINRKETLIGFYKTGTAMDETTMLIFSYYSEQLKEKKNKGTLPKPIILLVDPTMANNRLNIKVSSLSIFSSLCLTLTL